ncbi:MAG TPA: type II toxin-antitoxin system PemK/MazF family toxin [Opitutaceae bacterium]|nr:type II toxin-antitoxin system PemK/MazF family toxin [Opitutaceae bacterium]
MKLHRWDVVFVPSDEKDRVGHPAVVVSPPDILDDARQGRINVLIGTKKVPAETVKSHQVSLNGPDGLEFQTLINCALVYQVRKSSILRSAGSVSHARRGAIATRLRAALGLG